MSIKGDQEMNRNTINELNEVYLRVFGCSDANNYNSIEAQTLLLKKNAIGILNTLILSKKIFKKNNQIVSFLEIYFGIKLPKYIHASRTLMCGRISKYINGMEEYDDIINLLNLLYKALFKIDNHRSLLDKDINDVIRGINL